MSESIAPTVHDAPSRNHALVLLVDDQAMVAEAIRRIFATEPDIDLHCCADPTLAINLANQVRPTVILQDLVMPQLDGMDLVRQFRLNPMTRETPIIVLSSKENPQDKSDSFTAGANDYLVKLPDKIELLARVRFHSQAFLHRVQRDEAYRALRESQQQLLNSNSALISLNQKLEEATRVKSEFLANTSHEIRAPMNSVLGMTTLLLDTEMTDDQRAFVETIRQSSDAMLIIINDILDFSKIEAGKMDLEIQPFELLSCVEESLDLLATKAAEKNLDLVCLLDPSLPAFVGGDSTRVRQILLNLVSNAVKFTTVGEVVVSAESLPGTPDEKSGTKIVHFSVRDTGLGILLEKQERLFKAFSQVDGSTARQFGGTGLGLAISKQLTDLMGGRMWVESEAGSGAKFHFTALFQTVAAETKPRWKCRQSGLVGKRLLIIEDNIANGNLICHCAEQWGLMCQVATNASDALAQLNSDARFDTAILDMQLPESAGINLTAEMRRLSDKTQMTIIALSSLPLAARSIRLDQAEFSQLIYKPMRRIALLDALMRAMSPETASRKAPVASEFDRTLAERMPLRILVADDATVNQKVAEAFLRKMGYRADLASNGLEVLRALERQRYDVILLDVQMPELDGCETASIIRQKWSEPDRPRIIAMTGNAMRGDREMCLRAGMDDYLTKPVRVRELEAALRRQGRESKD